MFFTETVSNRARVTHTAAALARVRCVGNSRARQLRKTPRIIASNHEQHAHTERTSHCSAVHNRGDTMIIASFKLLHKNQTTLKLWNYENYEKTQRFLTGSCDQNNLQRKSLSKLDIFDSGP